MRLTLLGNKYFLKILEVKEMEKLLNENQVSELTGLAVQTLRNHRFKRIGIPYIKMMRSIRYDPKDIEGYVQHRKILLEDQEQ
jgi:hypothetical protein